MPPDGTNEPAETISDEIAKKLPAAIRRTDLRGEGIDLLLVAGRAAGPFSKPTFTSCTPCHLPVGSARTRAPTRFQHEQARRNSPSLSSTIRMRLAVDEEMSDSLGGVALQ